MNTAENALTRILIVEHDSIDVEIILNELDSGTIPYISKVVKSEPEYRKALIVFRPDIILSDYTFPAFDGPTAFKIKQMLVPDTPFIFVSGTIGEEKSIELIKTGVTDYALKDNLCNLNLKVGRALREAREAFQKSKFEHERQQSETRLARAQELAHMGSWELDFSDSTVNLSLESCRIFGIASEDHRQYLDTWMSFVHFDDLDMVLTNLKEARDSMSGTHVSYRIVRSDGVIRNIYSECRIEVDVNNRPFGLYGIAHDVTEKVMLENKLMHESIIRQNEITTAVLAAQENERADIGRELHDDLSQVLGATTLYIELAKSETNERVALLDKASGYIAYVIEEIRKLSKILVTSVLTLGLIDSIKILVADIRTIYPIKIMFLQNELNEDQIDTKLQMNVFRIVQEQMNNIIKHAQASEILINLTRNGDLLTLQISDNGIGCDMAEIKQGIGIINFNNRALLYKGHVSIISRPSKGFAISVTFQMNEHISVPLKTQIC